MHIARAYCVDASKIVDIYQARGLFFAQDQPRRRFEFLCSDDACRAANATKVTGVNYDKLVEDRMVLRPHFRMNPDSSHIDACEWVLRGRVSEMLGTIRGQTEERRAPHRFRHLKSSDLVDMFFPKFSRMPSKENRWGRAEGQSATERGCNTQRDKEMHQWARSSNRTRADFLETVVRVYELLEPEERQEATLRIGRGPQLAYSRAFCRVQHYFLARGDRIFHGGVRVQLHGPNFAVRFFDHVRARVASANENPVQVSLYLKREILLSHWNGRFLVEQLTAATRPGHYAHCYFFGRLVPHSAPSRRWAVEVEDLEHLVFVVRRKALSTPKSASQV